MFTRRQLMQGTVGAALAAPTWSSAAVVGQTSVRVREGWLEGAVEGGVRIFRGIPFAAAPVGPLRFKAPRPPARWSGVRPAITFGPAAMQVPRVGATTADANRSASSEDCLYLNVWTPLEGRDHPVLVYVHGGANVGGSTASPTLDGAAFARAGIVCVTPAYRVGALGFLELGGQLGRDYEGSGDSGLRDLIAALKWVQDNIASFGGAPDKVTLGGQSAGAKNVAALLAAPAAQGLFRAAISESGGGHTVHSRADADRLAGVYLDGLARAGVARQDLRTCPAATLMQAQAELVQRYPRAFPFRPTVGSGLLSQRPIDAIARGAARDVRLLIGWNREEAGPGGSLPTEPLSGKELANLDVSLANPALERFRTAHQQLSPLEQRIGFLSDEEYGVPTLRLALAKARQPQAAPVYGYRFDWKNGSGPAKGWASHSSEIQFMFAKPTTAVDEADIGMGDRLHRLWCAFIRTGRPDDGGAPAWPRLEAQRPSVIVFDRQIRVEPLDTVRLRLWDGLI